jgi:hypothetical protein
MGRRVWVLVVVAAAGAFAGLAPGWWVKGHESITQAAAARLPDELPAFFRNGGKHLAHFAGDPDRWKNRETPVLRAAERATTTSTWKTWRASRCRAAAGSPAWT